MVQRSNPPSGHGHGSAIVVSPMPPPVVWWGCGTVPVPPVVWWGWGTVPLLPLWCGGGMVLSPSPPCGGWECGMACWVCMVCMVGLVWHVWNVWHVWHGW